MDRTLLRQELILFAEQIQTLCFKTPTWPAVLFMGVMQWTSDPVPNTSEQKCLPPSNLDNPTTAEKHLCEKHLFGSGTKDSLVNFYQQTGSSHIKS